MTERKDREREFHDERFASGRRAHLDALYDGDPSVDRYRAAVQAVAPGRKVLEYGCGTGGLAFDLAASGAEVVAIDISPVAVGVASEEAARRGVAVQFEVMDAEALTLDDRSVDVVCGSGILHHLDVDAALGEVSRVVTEDGVAIFIEPLGHNPAINLFRRLTPGMRTEDEHPLLVADLERMGRRFGRVSYDATHLVALLGLLPGVPAAVSTALHRVDRRLFLRVPYLRRFAWMVVVTLEEPLDVHADSDASGAP